ncbi:MAG: PKD domain-containing protein [Metallibacterium sp.]
MSHIQFVCVWRKIFGYLTLVGAMLTAGPVAYANGYWAQTATHGFTIANFTIPAQSLGPLAGTTPLHILVGLRLQNATQLGSVIRAVNTPGTAAYGHFLTPPEFTTTFSPTTSQVQAVENYLTEMGFTNISVPVNNLYVTADGTAAAAEQAFNTPIWQYQVSGPNGEPMRTVYANTQRAEVPTSLANVVLSVVGLENIDTMHTELGSWPAAAPSAVPALGAPANPITFTPQDFWKVYDVGAVPPAANTTIAIIAEGNLAGVLPNDLRQFETENRLPQVPYQIIQTGAPSKDTSGDVEWDMDTQESTGIAGNLKELLVYDASSLNDADLIPAFNRYITDDQAVAASASFGGCETLEYLSGGMEIYDVMFSEMVAQGQTQFASSGDSGSACGVVGVTNGVPLSGAPGSVEYPASSIYVMGAGGTSLVVDSNYNVIQETSWDAGGGGSSLWEASPAWQQPFLPTGAAVNAVGIGKGVPDVAMDADFLLSPAGFVNAGADTSNGGTSLASPLSVGSWARLENAHNDQLGSAGPVLYSLSTPGLPFSTIGGMTDITVGSNGLYAATPGWDFTTGLGSFDIAKVNELLPPPGSSSGSGSGPVGGSPCIGQGTKVDSQAPGSQTGAPANEEYDVTGVSFAEPFSAKAPTLVITMDIGNLSALPALPPNSFWKVYFSYQGQKYFVDMDTNAPSATPATPEFVYGVTVASANGTSDVSFSNAAMTGTYSMANNTITFVLPTSLIVPPAKGCSLTTCSPGTSGTPPPPESLLTGVTGVTQLLAGAGAGLLETMDTSPTGTYTLVGNAACNPALPPVALLTVTPANAQVQAPITLDASGSHPPLAGGQMKSYTFDFGDNSAPVTQTGATITHTYSQSGSYQATVAVTDTGGGSATSQPETITVSSAAQPPMAALTASPTTGAPPLSVTFDASGSQDPNSNGGITQYVFNFGDSSAPITQSTPSVTHVYQVTGNYTASVQVTDKEGGTASATTPVNVTTSSAPPPTSTGSGTPPPSTTTQGGGGAIGLDALFGLGLLVALEKKWKWRHKKAAN